MNDKNTYQDNSEYFTLVPDDDNNRAQEQDPKDKNKFRDRCYHHSVAIIRLIKKLPKDEVNTAILNKLLRSAISIGASVVEAKATKSRKSYIKCYETALKSAVETKYWLSLVRDTEDVNKNTLNILLKENVLIAKTLESSLKTIKKIKPAVTDNKQLP